MSADTQRRETLDALVKRGWGQESAARTAAVLHPFDDRWEPASPVMEDSIRQRAFAVRWELDRSRGPEPYLERLVEDALRYYRECATAEDDRYYRAKYETLLASAPAASQPETEHVDDVEEGDYLSYGDEESDPGVLAVGEVEQEEAAPVKKRRRAAPRTVTAVAARTALWAGGLAATGMLLVSGGVLLIAGDTTRDPSASKATLDNVYTIVARTNTLLQVTLLVGTTLTLLAWAAWTYRMRKDAGSVETGLRWGPGWAWAGWLVPVLNLYLPYRLVQDSLQTFHRVARRDPRYRQLPHPGRSVRSWWTLLLVGGAAQVAGGVFARVAETPTTLHELAGTTLVIGLTHLVAGVCWLGALVSGSQVIGRTMEMRELAYRASRGSRRPLP